MNVPPEEEVQPEAPHLSFDVIVWLEHLKLQDGILITPHYAFLNDPGQPLGVNSSTAIARGKIQMLRDRRAERQNPPDPIVPAHVPPEMTNHIDAFIQLTEELIADKDFNTRGLLRDQLHHCLQTFCKGRHLVAGAEILPTEEGGQPDPRFVDLCTSWNIIAEYVLRSEAVRESLFRHLGVALEDVSWSCVICKFKSDSTSILKGQHSLKTYFRRMFVDIFLALISFTTKDLILKKLGSSTNLEVVKDIVDLLIGNTHVFLLGLAEDLTTDTSNCTMMLTLCHEMDLTHMNKIDGETFVDIALREEKRLNLAVVEDMRQAAVDAKEEKDAAAFGRLIAWLKKTGSIDSPEPVSPVPQEAVPSTSKQTDPVMKTGDTIRKQTSTTETGVANYSEFVKIDLRCWAINHLSKGRIIHGGSYGLVGLDFTPEFSASKPKISSIAVQDDQVYLLHYMDPLYYLDIINLSNKSTQKSVIQAIPGKLAQHFFNRIVVSRTHIYISEWLNMQIKVYNANTFDFLHDINTHDSPTSLELLPGEKLLVGLEEGFVVKLDGSRSKYEEEWNSGSCLDGSQPQSVIYDEENDVILVCTNDCNLYQLNFEGEVRKWHLAGPTEVMDMDLDRDDLNVVTWAGERFRYSLNWIRSQ